MLMNVKTPAVELSCTVELSMKRFYNYRVRDGEKCLRLTMKAGTAPCSVCLTGMGSKAFFCGWLLDVGAQEIQRYMYTLVWVHPMPGQCTVN